MAVQCGKTCEEKKMQQMLIKKEEEEKKKLEEYEKNQKEIEEFERKFGKKRIKNQKTKETSQKPESFWIRYKFVLISILILFFSIMTAYMFI